MTPIREETPTIPFRVVVGVGLESGRRMLNVFGRGGQRNERAVS
jgi:hypothetical protein